MKVKSIKYNKIDLSIFPKEREKKLKQIYRFSLFETSFYRSNLWMHTHRVLWIVEELIPIARKYLKFDPDMARTLALVHDDAEMITGDYQAGHKARMSAKELKKIEKEEEVALKKLASTYPKKINGYSYEKLLQHSLNKDCIEAQLVSYADKIDAYCESIHEILAGNIGFLRSVIFYVNVLTLFPKKFPMLKKFLSSKDSPFTYITDITSPERAYERRYTKLDKPHTKESIKNESDFPFYNMWRKIILLNNSYEGLQWLTYQKEHLKK